MRILVSMDADGSRFSYQSALRRLSGLPGAARVLKGVQPEKGTLGEIIFQAGTGWANESINFLPGGPERSRAELVFDITWAEFDLNPKKYLAL